MPQTTPADVLDAKEDLVRYRHATILYQEGDGKDAKHNWLQTGELIQVGKAWRLDPGAGAGHARPQTGHRLRRRPDSIPIPPGAEKLIKKLNELDQDGPASRAGTGSSNSTCRGPASWSRSPRLYTKAEDGPKRDVWIRQVADSYAAAAQQGDVGGPQAARPNGARRSRKTPASPVLPYIIFREISAEYAQKLANVGRDMDKLNKLQEDWKAKLTKFVARLPEHGRHARRDAAARHGERVLRLEDGRRGEGRLWPADQELPEALARGAGPGVPRSADHGRQAIQPGRADARRQGPVQHHVATWARPSSSTTGRAGTTWPRPTSARSRPRWPSVDGKAALVGVNLDAEGRRTRSPSSSRTRWRACRSTCRAAWRARSRSRTGSRSLPVMFLVGPDGKVVEPQRRGHDHRR